MHHSIVKKSLRNLMTMHRRQFLIVIALLGLLGMPFTRAANFTKGRAVAPFAAGLPTSISPP
jgi:hypothetical protein